MNAPNNHCIKKCQKGVLQKYLELCYSTILKLIIFVYSPFSNSLSHFVSLLIPLSTTASLSSHLSLTVGYSGVGRGSGVEVRLGSQIGVVWWRFLGFFGYVFWVHGYAAALYGGL